MKNPENRFEFDKIITALIKRLIHHIKIILVYYTNSKKVNDTIDKKKIQTNWIWSNHCCIDKTIPSLLEQLQMSPNYTPANLLPIWTPCSNRKTIFFFFKKQTNKERKVTGRVLNASHFLMASCLRVHLRSQVEAFHTERVSDRSIGQDIISRHNGRKKAGKLVINHSVSTSAIFDRVLIIA